MITFESYLNEGKSVGKIYHFTNGNIIDLILKDNILKSNKNMSQVGKQINQHGISTTRLKDGVYNIHGRHKGTQASSYGSFRITLDGDKLSNKYKIIPVELQDSNFYNAEEYIITKEIPNISDYIIAIDYNPKLKKTLKYVNELELKYNYKFGIIK